MPIAFVMRSAFFLLYSLIGSPAVDCARRGQCSAPLPHGDPRAIPCFAGCLGGESWAGDFLSENGDRLCFAGLMLNLRLINTPQNKAERSFGASPAQLSPPAQPEFEPLPVWWWGRVALVALIPVLACPILLPLLRSLIPFLLFVNPASRVENRFRDFWD